MAPPPLSVLRMIDHLIYCLALGAPGRKGSTREAGTAMSIVFFFYEVSSPRVPYALILRDWERTSSLDVD